MMEACVGARGQHGAQSEVRLMRNVWQSLPPPDIQGHGQDCSLTGCYLWGVLGENNL